MGNTPDISFVPVDTMALELWDLMARDQAVKWKTQVYPHLTFSIALELELSEVYNMKVSCFS
jgi:hypothetical protein